MERRDLPDVLEPTFGIASLRSVKLLTSATPLHEKHSACWPVIGPFEASCPAHAILRFASQKYYFKSQIPDPDPCHSGGLGQQ
jgi:hypothetical protein